MKILVLPDVCNKTIWKENIKYYFSFVDHVYFTGDYFEHCENSTLEDGKEAVENFEEIIQLKKQFPDKVHLCFGERDLQYLFFSNSCEDFRKEFSESYRKALIENAEYLKMVYEVPEFRWNGKPVVVSHAGVTNTWYNLVENSMFGGLQFENETTEMSEVTRINLIFDFCMSMQQRLLKLSKESSISDLPDGEKVAAATALALFSFPEDCWDDDGDSINCPPTWIRPNALFNDALFENQIVGHTNTYQDGVSFFRATVEERTSKVVLVDSPSHDNVLVLDSNMEPSWQDLRAEPSEVDNIEISQENQ